MWGSLGNPLAWPGAAVCLSGSVRWLAGQHLALSGGLSVCLACLLLWGSRPYPRLYQDMLPRWAAEMRTWRGHSSWLRPGAP